MSTRAPVPTVRLIIRNDAGQVLILRRPDNSHGAGGWCLPGGKVDFGDTVEETVDKELFEETELKCTNKRFLFYQDSPPDEHSDMHVINFYFDCEVDGEISINEESSEYAWVSVDDIGRYPMVFRNGDALQEYWEQTLSV